MTTAATAGSSATTNLWSAASRSTTALEVASSAIAETGLAAFGEILGSGTVTWI
jgi:hypothetical protein